MQIRTTTPRTIKRMRGRCAHVLLHNNLDKQSSAGKMPSANDATIPSRNAWSDYVSVFASSARVAHQ